MSKDTSLRTLFNQDLLFLLSFLKAEAKERNSGQQRKNACQDAWLSVLFTGLRELSCSWSLGYWCCIYWLT
jgi:hypothetical protein